MNVKPTYTVNYTRCAIGGRTTGTRAFYLLREARAFCRDNPDASGYILRQTYENPWAAAKKNTLVAFFNGFEHRMSAGEHAHLQALLRENS